MTSTRLLADIVLRDHVVQVSFVLCLAVLAPVARWSAAQWGWSRLAALGAAAGLALVVAVTLVRPGNGLGVQLSSVGNCIGRRGIRLHGPLQQLQLLVYMPFAFCAVWATRRVWPVVAAVAGLSMAIEAVQAATGRGVCESGDVMRNVAGGLLAAGVAAVAVKGLRRLRPAPASEPTPAAS